MKGNVKYCAACEDMFDPKVSKIAKYCSSDCAYDHACIQTIECPICDDEFDPKFTKTFENCGCVKTEAYMRCQECVDLYPGAPCPKHAVPLPAPETIKMYCDHGLVPPGGCKACYEENPRNWNLPPDWIKNERVIPLSGSMKQPFIGDSLDKINWDLENKK